MKALLEIQKQMEIDFLKEHSYEQINDMFRELKTKLDKAESKVKNLDIQRVSQQSEQLVNFLWEQYKINRLITKKAYMQMVVNARKLTNCC